MPDFECREHFLCWKLRARVEEVAEIQNRITEDVYLFRHSGEDVKNKFKDTRQWYLQLLGMSLSQLRQTMNTSDPDISADEFAVERIMKRVRPMSERYLERLVEDEFISQDDMDCIIVGGYNDVQEYFEDLNTNMAAVGSNLTVSSLPEDPSTTLDTNQPRITTRRISQSKATRVTRATTRNQTTLQRMN